MGMKSEVPAASTKIVEERQVKRITSEPCSKISELNKNQLNDISEHLKREMDNASKRLSEQMEMMIKTFQQKPWNK